MPAPITSSIRLRIAASALNGDTEARLNKDAVPLNDHLMIICHTTHQPGNRKLI